MTQKELFKAVTGQCVWCAEQWPVVRQETRLVHVGPFTADPQLFNTPCKAGTIRLAFNYLGYKGGQKTRWKARSPQLLKQLIQNNYEISKGLCHRLNSPENRAFWRTGIEASLHVAEWPAWMRGNQEITPPQQLERYRQELRFMDECDYWARQKCSDNLQYRAVRLAGMSNLPEPTCNGGFGCTTCWGLYERAQEELDKACCY